MWGEILAKVQTGSPWYIQYRRVAGEAVRRMKNPAVSLSVLLSGKDSGCSRQNRLIIYMSIQMQSSGLRKWHQNPPNCSGCKPRSHDSFLFFSPSYTTSKLLACPVFCTSEIILTPSTCLYLCISYHGPHTILS